MAGRLQHRIPHGNLGGLMPAEFRQYQEPETATAQPIAAPEAGRRACARVERLCAGQLDRLLSGEYDPVVA